MKTSFVSFLLAGKVASMPVIADLSFASIAEGSNKSLVHNYTHAASAQNSPVNESIIFDEHKSGIKDNANLYKNMDFLITGLSDKNEVIVGISHGKDDPALLDVNPRLRIALHDLIVLTHFSVINTTDINRPSFFNKHQDDTLLSVESEEAVSIPVDFSGIASSMNKTDDLYLQIIVAPNSGWDWRNVRCSEVFKVKFHNNSIMLFSAAATEDCTKFRCY